MLNFLNTSPEEITTVILSSEPNETNPYATAFSGDTVTPVLKVLLREAIRTEMNIFSTYSTIEKDIETCDEIVEYSLNKFDPSLINWKYQGVLCFNSSLTSISGISMKFVDEWRRFIFMFLKAINFYCKQKIDFIFLGVFAQNLISAVGTEQALKFPSPMVEVLNNKGFFNCGMFEKTNKKINWFV